MAKFAHFESVPANSLISIYTRHAEVARDIHAYAVREFTGRDDIEVDLVRRDPNVPDTETLDIMSQYDSISVSSGLTSFGQTLREGLVDAVHNVQERFQGPMPALIIAAGNDGTESGPKGMRITELMRNGLAVGESNQTGSEWYIEAHSSNKPNIAAPNPFDEQKFRFIDLSPDLNGHEEIIEEYLTNEEFSKRLQAQEDHLKSLEPEARSRAMQNIMLELLSDTEAMNAIARRVSDIVANPEQFHQKILAHLRHSFDFDQNGYVSGVDGTSFSGPYLAGHISGAILLEEERADSGLPALTTEEIMTLAKLSTEQVSRREGIYSDEETNMHYWQNKANQGFTSHGGHGVFSAEKFRMLLDEAHQVLETSPDINRENVVYTLQGQRVDSHTTSFQMPEHGTQDLVFEKMILIFKTPDIYGANAITLARGSDDPRVLQPTYRDDLNWLATDRYFGETIQEGETWQVKAITHQNQGSVENASLTLFAYNQQSLMGQMIAKYGDRPEIQKTPEIREDWRKAIGNEEFPLEELRQLTYNNLDPQDMAAP